MREGYRVSTTVSAAATAIAAEAVLQAAFFLKSISPSLGG
jgi:hypothetical protein